MPRVQFDNEKMHTKHPPSGFYSSVFVIVQLKLDRIYHFDPLFFPGFLLFTTAFETAGTFTVAKWVQIWPDQRMVSLERINKSVGFCLLVIGF
jgi:hypothetical protein